MMDEKLLKAIDSDEDVEKTGRSAFFRQAAAAYLQHKRKASIAREYRAAYSSGKGLKEEFEGWEEEGIWPEI